MDRIPLYPLRFEPIYQYRLWGGRRLANLLPPRCPTTSPLAKRGFSATARTMPASSQTGMLKGRTLGHLLEQAPEQFLGKLAGHYTRFPLLLEVS